MPLYEVEHITPLSVSQKHSLAKDITQIHSQLFTTPSLFVNRQANSILAHVRPGGGRSTADFNKLCTSVTEAWEKIVNPHKKKSEDLELRAIFVLGTIIAGSEAGFELPPAGKDKMWLKENVTAFKAKADEGDEDFQDMLEEMRTRDDLKELL
ncbi:hypothetical protein OEA41_001298 [Lepraria neglecta]|uniref:Tautomerase cis-CaaD-like domain-containing protein n=1 Tax=Lepraria neglecta TaxID=209136 RepID=A0AAD9Z9T0_9LECA|nr:hypothetical protein OEA41_001298 [Lepraria neglecta]